MKEMCFIILVSNIVLFMTSDSYIRAIENRISDNTIFQFILILLGFPFYIIIKTLSFVNYFTHKPLISNVLNYQPFKKRE